MRILMFGRCVIATIHGYAFDAAGHGVQFPVRPGRAAPPSTATGSRWNCWTGAACRGVDGLIAPSARGCVGRSSQATASSHNAYEAQHESATLAAHGGN